MQSYLMKSSNASCPKEMVEVPRQISHREVMRAPRYGQRALASREFSVPAHAGSLLFYRSDEFPDRLLALCTYFSELDSLALLPYPDNGPGHIDVHI